MNGPLACLLVVGLLTGACASRAPLDPSVPTIFRRAAPGPLDGPAVTRAPDDSFITRFGPGSAKIAYAGHETVARATVDDGWPPGSPRSPAADRIWLVRPSGTSGQPERVNIDLARLRAGDRSQDYLLEPGDILTAPLDGAQHYYAPRPGDAK